MRQMLFKLAKVFLKEKKVSYSIGFRGMYVALRNVCKQHAHG